LARSREGVGVGNPYWNGFPGMGAFRYGSDTSTLTNLGTFGGTFAEARGINDAGQIVGGASTASGNEHAFLLSNGTMTDLGTLGGSSSTACAINSSGAVAGYAATVGGQNHAFLYNGTAMTDLGTI